MTGRIKKEMGEHRKLVERGGFWLNNRIRCSVVLLERGSGWENPDVIGWHGWTSYLIEVKVSRADFFADAKKNSRHFQGRYSGMGCYRYYLCPQHLIQPEEVPEGWGLLWAYENQIRQQVDAPFHELSEVARNHETELLVRSYANLRFGAILTKGGEEEWQA